MIARIGPVKAFRRRPVAPALAEEAVEKLGQARISFSSILAIFSGSQKFILLITHDLAYNIMVATSELSTSIMLCM